MIKNKFLHVLAVAILAVPLLSNAHAMEGSNSHGVKELEKLIITQVLAMKEYYTLEEIKKEIKEELLEEIQKKMQKEIQTSPEKLKKTIQEAIESVEEKKTKEFTQVYFFLQKLVSEKTDEKNAQLINEEHAKASYINFLTLKDIGVQAKKETFLPIIEEIINEKKDGEIRLEKIIDTLWNEVRLEQMRKDLPERED